jgi:hypothetical protein
MWLDLTSPRLMTTVAELPCGRNFCQMTLAARKRFMVMLSSQSSDQTPFSTFYHQLPLDRSTTFLWCTQEHVTVMNTSTQYGYSLDNQFGWLTFTDVPLPWRKHHQQQIHAMCYVSITSPFNLCSVGTPSVHRFTLSVMLSPSGTAHDRRPVVISINKQPHSFYKI